MEIYEQWGNDAVNGSPLRGILTLFYKKYRWQLPLRQLLLLTRCDKPWGTVLLLWPTLWALWLSNGGMPALSQLWIFMLGSILMRACGCVINDYCDHTFDKCVRRTRTRPIASGEVSKQEAVTVAVALALMAGCLLYFLKWQTRWLAVMGFILTMVYPTCKRWLRCPQLFLGMTFAWGIPMAFSESDQGLTRVCWILYGLTALWIIGYDTIYAMQDLNDDMHLPIYTMPKYLRGEVREFVSIVYGLFTMGLGILAYTLGMGWVFFVAWGCALWVLKNQVQMLNTQDEGRYLRAFKSNQWVGLLIWLAILLGRNSLSV